MVESWLVVAEPQVNTGKTLHQPKNFYGALFAVEKLSKLRAEFASRRFLLVRVRWSSV